MLLTHDVSIPIAFVVFDVLSLDGENLMGKPYWRRREILESLRLAGHTGAVRLRSRTAVRCGRSTAVPDWHGIGRRSS
jgi:ATP-dependent DNA ligase